MPTTTFDQQPTETEQLAELLDSELDAVTGAVSDLGKYITKAVDDAISGGSGPPEVWGRLWVGAAVVVTAAVQGRASGGPASARGPLLGKADEFCSM